MWELGNDFNIPIIMDGANNHIAAQKSAKIIRLASNCLKCKKVSNLYEPRVYLVDSTNS